VQISASYFNKLLDTSFRENEFGKQDLMKDFLVASMLMQSKVNVIVLLAGTSGTGKSTLASLVGARFGIQTVLSTDSIRHVMRNFVMESQNPILFCSTYEAGGMVPPADRVDLEDNQITIKGYRKQSKLVQAELIKVLEQVNSRKESIVVEGVHLDVKFLQKMLARFPSCIPFVLHIKSKNKHGERFAVRAKHMTIDPKFNKYI
jgi:2-phosphoglycerate kinase